MNNLEVRCYSGHTYPERPESFRWMGMDFDVQEVERAWQEPGEKCFLVRAENRRFKLCYNEANAQWSLTELDRS